MKYIPLQTLAAERFGDRSKARWLQSLARRGELIGARQIGGRWHCDIDAFDAAARVPAVLAPLLATE